ncbi:MAG TPA: response regulator transcription factor [Candidatus Polarisedimenticolia bacterium]|nr:response regulator transcription factor [Candidatus Polarisedimenticolia bacterium]
MAGGRIRLLLADDHTLMRQGLRAILDKEADIRIVAEAEDGRDVVRKAIALKPDVVLMDISMPRLTGIEATQRIRAELPETRVVALSMHDDDEQVEAVLQAGAGGYVLKDARPLELLAAIRIVSEGGVWLSPRISARILRQFLDAKALPAQPGCDPIPMLTTREDQVLRLIQAGKTSREIGETLEVAVKTVTAHRTTLMRKLKVHNVGQLLAEATRLGIIKPI